MPLAGFSTGFALGGLFVWCGLEKLLGRVGKCDLRKEARPAALIANTDILKECYC